MKYITFRGATGLEEILIFCEVSGDCHAKVAEKLGVLDKIISAGFLTFTTDGDIHCGGESESLKQALRRDVISRGEVDEKLFIQHNYTSAKVGGDSGLQLFNER